MYVSLMGQFTAINNTVAGNVTNQGSSIWVSGPLADMAIYNNILQGQSGQTSIYGAQASGNSVAIDNDINAWHASAVQGCLFPSGGTFLRALSLSIQERGSTNFDPRHHASTPGTTPRRGFQDRTWQGSQGSY